MTIDPRTDAEVLAAQRVTVSADHSKAIVSYVDFKVVRLQKLLTEKEKIPGWDTLDTVR